MNCLAKCRSKKGKCMVSLQGLEKVSIRLSGIVEIEEYYPGLMGHDGTDRQTRDGRRSNSGRDFEVNTD